MNFTTELPKKDPLVSYIVASAMKCAKFFPGSEMGPVFRMHAAIVFQKKTPLPGWENYHQTEPMILCHIRKVVSKTETPNAEEAKDACPMKRKLRHFKTDPKQMNEDSGCEKEPRSKHLGKRKRAANDSDEKKSEQGDISPTLSKFMIDSVRECQRRKLSLTSELSYNKKSTSYILKQLELSPTNILIPLQHMN